MNEAVDKGERLSKFERDLASMNREIRYSTHDLYKTGDPNAPQAILDRNGEVVLDLCKRCGRGEAELLGPCDRSARGDTDVPICGGHAQAWFCERNHLTGDHRCVVCAFLGQHPDNSSAKSPTVPEPPAGTWRRGSWFSKPMDCVELHDSVKFVRVTLTHGLDKHEYFELELPPLPVGKLTDRDSV